MKARVIEDKTLDGLNKQLEAWATSTNIIDVKYSPYLDTFAKYAPIYSAVVLYEEK